MPSDVLIELEGSWLTTQEQAPMRGYACLVSRRHVVELHELSEAEGSTFMRDLRKVSKALSLVTGAAKLNYEIHGNTIPHLHVHLYPRQVGDAFEDRPINPKEIADPVYSPGEYASFRSRLLKSLTADGA
jgi:diadenosine tetraphosphate (Ap4A) HIT family hydrolase